MRFSFAETAFTKCIDDALGLVSAVSSLPLEQRETALRGGVMLIVSAFDFFIHELVRIEISRKVSEKSTDLKLAIPYNLSLFQGDQLVREIDLHIRRSNSYKSFVGSSNIKECFGCLSVNIWHEVESRCGREVQGDKKILDEIWRWRNRIAHEGDMVPSNALFYYWPIYIEDVEDAAKFLKSLAHDVAKTLRDIN